MSNNHKEQYSYFCQTENKWINEERDKSSIPSKCKNDVNHTIKLNTIKLTVLDYCYFIDDTNIPEIFDLNSLNYSSMTDEGKKILGLVRALLICAKNRNLISM